MTAQFGDGVRSRFGCRRYSFELELVLKQLKLDVCSDCSSRSVRYFWGNGTQEQQAPRYWNEDGQGEAQAAVALKLPFLNTASCLESFEKLLDDPSGAVVVNYGQQLLLGCNGFGRVEKPGNG